MPNLTLEQRVAALERQMAALSGSAAVQPATPWWKQVQGIFSGDPAAYDEAARLGREYRESLRPAANKPKRTARAKKPVGTKRK